MSDFAFVPRSISKRGVPTTQPSYTKNNETRPPTLPSSSAPPKAKPKFTGDDILTLLRLCLSQYSCWCDPKLLGIMKESREGYVPIQYLLQNVPALSELENRPTELGIVQGLRTVEVEHEFDIRIIIQEPPTNDWLQPDAIDTRTAGMFEVRRKDYEVFLRSLEEHSSVDKNYWNARTVYIERFPTVYRTKHAISQYINYLLINLKHDLVGSSKGQYPIQAITFPPHHSSQKETLSRYKGFAFVVMDSPSSVNALCDAYPSSPVDSAPPVQSATQQSTDKGGHQKHSPDPKAEAIKFGTRMLSMSMWNKFKDEYLEYQRRILTVNKEVNGRELTGMPSSSTLEQETPVLVQNQTGISKIRPLPPPAGIEFSPRKTYPENCLVFVKNVHPETNKTTLRQLFASILSSPSLLDYIDFTKGTDSCHLRLSSASEAMRLVSCFNPVNRKSAKAQVNALDDQGGTPTADRPAIVTELVQGKREELYWEKVPLKSREKALITARNHSASPHGHGLGELLKTRDEGDTASKAKRKKK